MKRVQLFLVSIALVSTLGACTKNDPTNEGDGTPKTKQEIEASFGKNYRISYNVESEGQPTYHLFQARCAQGWATSMTVDDESQIYLVNEAGKKMYILDPAKKTGESYPYDPSMTFPDLTETNAWIYFHLSFVNLSDFIRTDKTETVAGRKATVYTCKYADGDGTFWIDNQYGFTLKYVQTGGQAQDIHVEATEFKTGGVTMANMVNLSEYKITAGS